MYVLSKDGFIKLSCSGNNPQSIFYGSLAGVVQNQLWRNMGSVVTLEGVILG